MKKRNIIFQIGPAMILLIIFFIIPMIYLVIYSFSKYDPINMIESTFTFENFQKFLTDTHSWTMIIRTLKVSFFASIITLILGYPLAFYMRISKGKEKTLFAIIVLTPLMISYVILGFAWVLILSPKSGIISTILNSTGILSGSLNLMSTETGIVIGLVHFTLVYMVLNLHSALETIDMQHIRTALTLGANYFQVFIRIILPLSLPGIFSGVILTFAVASNALMIPLMIGGRTVEVLAVNVFDLNSQILNWPMGATAGLILLILALIPISLVSIIVNKLTRKLNF